MADCRPSATGAPELSEQARRLVARTEAAAERIRSLGPQEPSEASQRTSTDGEPVERLLRIGRVPDLYREAVWEKVRAPEVKEWTLALGARTQKRTEPGTLNWSLLGHGLLILGPVGTGKSSSAALICREAAALQRSVRWSYVPDLSDLLAQNPKARSQEIRMQEATDLLVWDDMLVRDLADWEIGYLDQIVEARYRSRKPMIVTTNKTREDLLADPRLARMVDRWRERVCSGMTVLEGASMRSRDEV